MSPSHVEWGWMKGPANAWEPHWSDLRQASVSCLEFLKYGRVKDCKCVKAELACTPLCKFRGWLGGGGADRV